MAAGMAVTGGAGPADVGPMTMEPTGAGDLEDWITDLAGGETSLRRLRKRQEALRLEEMRLEEMRLEEVRLEEIRAESGGPILLRSRPAPGDADAGSAESDPGALDPVRRIA
jgi:hypothetical protein